MPPKQRYGSEHPAAALPGCPGVQGPSLYPRQLEMQGSPPSKGKLPKTRIGENVPGEYGVRLVIGRQVTMCP
ncbi:uncharacterized protein FRV6_03822 [Fusarium oxysporum]|uniref:Uncharacterized protein n=1 Tax=Fusarium oxysporum TaxID=5507 RepID=A0A2H3SWK2_FUSOX|nr:uncharacterized protein FRV6_03822 [Fusarium oxysporum]